MKNSYGLPQIIRNYLIIIFALVALICVAVVAVWLNTISTEDSVLSQHPELSFASVEVLIGLIPMANILLFVSAVALVMNILDAFTITVRSLINESPVKESPSSSLQQGEH